LSGLPIPPSSNEHASPSIANANGFAAPASRTSGRRPAWIGDRRRPPYEANLRATSGAVPAPKVWDRSPIDPQSFDVTQPPDLLDAPVNNVAPMIIGDAIVGVTLAGTTGTWATQTGISYFGQWTKDGAALPVENGITYTLVDADIGALFTFAVTCLE
jgi:hypothetical protein